MQRLVLSAFLTSTLLVGPALAGPQSLSPEVRIGTRPVIRVQQVPIAPQRQAQARAPQAAPVQVAQARPAPSFGGGFLEVLFGGGASRSAQPTSVYYGGQPVGDLGPGMVESPNSPGGVAVDPRYMRQEVNYDGAEEPGTIIVNTNQRMLYLVQSKGRAIRYGIGVGRPGFTWAGTHHITNKREWPNWTPPPEMLRRRPDLPRHMEGGPEIRSALARCISARRSIGSTGQTSPGPSARRCLQGASACATRTSSTFTAGSRSAPRSS